MMRDARSRGNDSEVIPCFFEKSRRRRRTSSSSRARAIVVLCKLLLLEQLLVRRSSSYCCHSYLLPLQQAPHGGPGLRPLPSRWRVIRGGQYHDEWHPYYRRSRSSSSSSFLRLKPSIGTIRLFSSTAASSSSAAGEGGTAEQEEGDAPLQPTPYVTGVTLKLAVDRNGAAADLDPDGFSGRFTCDESLDMVHRLRRDSDAVLVGRGTVVADDPSLTVRRGYDEEEATEAGGGGDGANDGAVSSSSIHPLRVVLDPDLQLVIGREIEGERDYTLFHDGLPTVVYHCVRDVDETLLDLEDEGVILVYLPPLTTDNGDAADDEAGETADSDSAASAGRRCRLNLREVVKNLSDRFQVEHLMVEGGPVTARNFLKEKLVDRAIIVRAGSPSVQFKKPLDSGIDDAFLKSSGLTFLGTEECGIDKMEYWSRDGPGSWPTQSLQDWP